MDLRDLEVFIAVAEELHFGRAAARIHLSQPSVTRIVKALESDLEVELLDRSGRQVELTAAGLAFFEHARVLCATAERSVAAARRAAQGEVEPLILGLSDALTPLSAQQPLERFRQAHPEIGLELRRVATAAQLRALREHRCDLVLSPTPLEHPELCRRQIGRESLVAVLPRLHPLTEQDPVDLATLMDHTRVMLREASEPLLFRDIEAECQARGIELRPERIDFRVEDVVAMLVLVATGLAVSAMPSSIRQLHHAGVVYRPVVPEVEVKIHVMWWTKNARPALESFLAGLPPCDADADGPDG